MARHLRERLLKKPSLLHIDATGQTNRYGFMLYAVVAEVSL